MIAIKDAKPQINSAKIGGITLYRWSSSFGRADGTSHISRYYLAVLPKTEKPMEILGALMEPEYVKETRTTRGTVEIVGASREGSRVDAFYKPARDFMTGGIRYKLSAVREARALFHIIENGRKAEAPLAIYFDSSGNQALITKKVDGTVLSKANMSFEKKLDVFLL